MTADNHMNDVMSRWGYDPLLPSQVNLEQIQLYRPSNNKKYTVSIQT